MTPVSVGHLSASPELELKVRTRCERSVSKRFLQISYVRVREPSHRASSLPSEARPSPNATVPPRAKARLIFEPTLFGGRDKEDLTSAVWENERRATDNSNLSGWRGAFVRKFGKRALDEKGFEGVLFTQSLCILCWSSLDAILCVLSRMLLVAVAVVVKRVEESGDGE